MKTSNLDENVDFKALFGTFLKKWYVFSITLLISFTIAFLYIKNSPSVYAVKAIFKLNTESSKTERILEADILGENKVNIEDEIITIQSRQVIRQTIDQLDFGISYYTQSGLARIEQYKLDFPFKIEIDSSKFQLVNTPIHIRVESNETFELDYEVEDNEVSLYNSKEELLIQQQLPEKIFEGSYQFGEEINDPNLGIKVALIGDPLMYGEDKLYFMINDPISLTDQYSQKLEINLADRNSNILFLSTGGSIIQKEISFLNTLMELVARKNLDKKNQEALKTIDFIDFQLADVSSSLNKAETDLESIGYTNTLIGEASVLYEKRDQLESQMATYNVRLSNLKAFLNNLDNMDGTTETSSAALNIEDAMIDNLIIKLTELNQNRAQLRRTATEANPMLQRVNLEIRTTKDALRNAINGAINTHNVIIEDLYSRLQQTNNTINKLPGAERRKLGIQRKFEFSDNTYDLFMQRKATAGIALATNESDWSIIESARLDEANGLISPKINFVLLLAIILGLGLPAVIITIFNYFDDRIKNKKDIEKNTKIPILGSIIKGERHNAIVTALPIKSHFVESVRDVKINLQYLSPRSTNKVIGFTSSSSGEGKTFCAVNLGIVLAQSGKKVLLIDVDLRNSGMGNFLKIKNNNNGLSNYLIGNTPLNNIITPTQVKNLNVILSGSIPPNPSDLLSLGKNETFINELKEKFDYLILDFPPVGIVNDFIIFSKYLDISIYVLRYKYTRIGQLDKINQLYNDKKIKNLSIIFNDVRKNSLYGSSQYYDNYFHKDKSNRSFFKKKKISDKYQVLEDPKVGLTN